MVTRISTLPAAGPAFATDDLEEARLAAQELLWARIAARATDDGPFRLAAEGARVRGSFLGHLSGVGSFVMRVSPLSEFYILSLPVKCTVRHEVDGELIDAGASEAALVSPGRALVTRMPPRWELAVFVLARSSVERELGGSSPGRGGAPVFPPRIALRSPSGQALSKLGETLLAAGFAGAPNGAFLSWLERTLVGLMVHTQPFRRSEVEPQLSPSATASVSRVEAYVTAHPGEAHSLSELARIAETSVRSLQLAFHRLRGQGPTERARQIRLELARKALAHGTSDTRVANVALRCGFSHLGRFSAAYARSFGEAPSQTLRCALARRRSTP